MSNTIELLWTDEPSRMNDPRGQYIAAEVGETLTLDFAGATATADVGGRVLEFWLAPLDRLSPAVRLGAPVLHLADGRFSDATGHTSGRSGSSFRLTLDSAELVVSARCYYWEVRDTAAAQVLAYGELDLAATPAFSTVIASSPVLVGFALADPDADRIAFWDDSAGAFAWLSLGSGLSITGTVLSAPGGGGGAVSSVAGRTGDVVLVEGDVANLTADLAAKAPLASPALSGTPTGPTAAPGTNTTELATTAFVTAAVAGGLAIGKAVGGGTAGRVLFEGAGPALADSSLLTFDVATKTVSLFNSYTDASNYERAFLRWVANVLTIGTEAAGTGTARTVQIGTASVGNLYVTADGKVGVGGPSSYYFGVPNGYSAVIGGISFWSAPEAFLTGAGVFAGSGAVGLYNYSGPVEFHTASGAMPVRRGSVSALGSFVLGVGALATSATDGFTYLPSCAGTPTGTPTAVAGMVPMIVDTTASKVWFYVGGAWKFATLN